MNPDVLAFASAALLLVSLLGLLVLKGARPPPASQQLTRRAMLFACSSFLLV